LLVVSIVFAPAHPAAHVEEQPANDAGERAEYEAVEVERAT
jgi:hypothetical protein